MKICLVSSPGGHFFELKTLTPTFENLNTFWVTIKSIDTANSLHNNKVYYAHAPTTRNFLNLFKNSYLALKILIKEKPTIIISTGGPICIPFFYIGKLLGIKSIYIESLTRIHSLSLTGKIVYPVANIFLVQWETLLSKYKKAKYKGQII